MVVTLYLLASRFLGIAEVAGPTANPQILAMLRLDMRTGIVDDSTPWCAAFVSYIAWLLDLPRSKSLAARSWLKVGMPVELDQALVGFDVVVLSRGDGPQPGPEVLQAPGHVGFYAGRDGKDRVKVLGGNQGNAVSIDSFPVSRVLGIRRVR